MKCPVCKKNIPDSSLKCPYCKTRTGIQCTHCGTINPVGTLTCQNCSQELLKICSHCKSVNFPIATKCRKCGSPFGNSTKKRIEKSNLSENVETSLAYLPKLYNQKQAFEMLVEGLKSNEKKIFSITGEKGIGKTSLLKRVIQSMDSENLEWCIGKCTPLTQLTPGGVVQDMLLNLFKLPNFYLNDEELNNDALKFFSTEFRFLNQSEVSDFLNFIYNSKDGNYEDIIINKKKTYQILDKIFDAFCATGRFVFVIDNFDFIDGFSIEFLTNFIQRENNWKNLKFIAIYTEHKPVTGYFGIEKKEIKAYLNIPLAPTTLEELKNNIDLKGTSGTYVSPREIEVIMAKSRGNFAFVEQAISYCFDCQISDKAFILPQTFQELIKERLLTLKKFNKSAYKLLCGAAVLGDRLNFSLLKQVFGYKAVEFNDIMNYLVKSKFVHPYNENFYEFNNLLLWETILKNIQHDENFEDINVKVGKAVSVFSLNTNATMAMIAHNLKENRMAFDIWTKTTRLASYVGDINLYVIAQKQCLALLNEFNENETLNIRYNISERLGKLLTEYDPQEAIEFLPDAISDAKAKNSEVKEIELLGYLALCCKKSGNYFGDIECVDTVLTKLTPSQELEGALIKASKLSSLISIGNCGEAINLIDNDIIPILETNIANPRLSKIIPQEFIYDTWFRVYLYLAIALALQGNDRAFEVLAFLFEAIEKHKLNDLIFSCNAKLVLAYANTMKGNFDTSYELLSNVVNSLGIDLSDTNNLNLQNSEIINVYNLISVINDIITHKFEDLREKLFNSAIFAGDTEQEYFKNIFKTFLGKVFYESKQAKHAVSVYNEQVTFFANNKLAMGALIAWYLIAQATIITENPKNAIEIASQALEIAQNPKINNIFFIVQLKILLAQAYNELSDFETAKINLESAMILAKKYNMKDLMSKIYFNYGNYYQDLGQTPTQANIEYLKGAKKMYNKALDLIIKNTKNTYLKEKIETKNTQLEMYCQTNGFEI